MAWKNDPIVKSDKITRHLAEIDLALTRASLRRRAYLSAGEERSAQIEEAVIDRRLCERKVVTG